MDGGGDGVMKRDTNGGGERRGGEGKKMQRGGECGLLETASGVFVMPAGAQKCFAEGEDMSGFSSDVVKKDQDHKK